MKLPGETGSALVEMAISLFLLVILVFGIIEFGRALYIKNTLTNAAREGARLAVVSTSTTLNVPEIESRVHAVIPDNILADGVDIVVTPAAGLQHQETQIDVQVSQQFTSVVPLLFPGLHGRVLRGEATMLYE